MENKVTRCPDCRVIVESLFDHVDIDCSYQELEIFDKVDLEHNCECCGGGEFIIDGDGVGKFWALCVSDTENCFKTYDLPDNIKIIE